MSSKYGLIGYPLEHSFSKEYFNAKFQSEEIDAEYLNFEISSIADLPKIIDHFPELKGINVTIPYKEKIIPFLSQIDSNAQAIGAVNVVKIMREKGKTNLIGYNSDIIGFTQSIRKLLDKHPKKALILGTGGASKAIFHGLKNLGIESKLVSRTKNKNTLTYEELTSEVMAKHQIIVNTTPVGLYPNADCSPNIPYKYLTSSHLLYDLLYNPETTLFMKKGAEQGAVTKNGMEMLHLQALAAWDIWSQCNDISNSIK